MKNVLILGAGKSSASLIQYMLSHAKEYDWMITVGDISIEAAEQKIEQHEQGKAIYFSVDDEKIRTQYVQDADIVLSLLPASLHTKVAADCIKNQKHFVSASYVSDTMRNLHEEAIQQDVILLNEIGLDPGLDHLSAIQMIDNVHRQEGKVTSFESYTGGLIAPESDNNPWHYKFTWNPRNVVLAGQGTAKFLVNDQFRYIPYQKLFLRYDVLSIPGYGEFEGYPNRDSLQYRSIYNLHDVKTMVRGTLRRKGFCDAWNVFVQLGMTDDSYSMERIEDLTWREYTRSFLPHTEKSVEEELKDYLMIQDETIIDKLEWLGLFTDEKIELQEATPAQALQKLLEEKWKLDQGDKDMCVMLHLMEYAVKDKMYRMQSSMVAVGEDERHTAMAKTVGLPMAIAAKMILNNEIKRRGVVIPVFEDIYMPILNELKNNFGIEFTENIVEINK